MPSFSSSSTSPTAPAAKPVIHAKNSIELLHSSLRSKPRGVRKKWGFHFGGSKSGSLKSIKSNRAAEGGGEGTADKDYSGGRFGPMMMATLHGLTRSRPDLLTESLATFSTFTAPAKMPKDEIGAHLEAKLNEG